MTDPTAPDETASALADVFQRALREGAILLASVTGIGVVVGALVSGAAGVWGALLGAAVAAFFSGTTIVVMARTTQSTPAMTAMAVMGSWLVKIVLLVVALAVLRGMEFYDRWVFGIVLLVGVMGAALLDFRAVNAGRIPYVTPSSTPRADSGEQ